MIAFDYVSFLAWFRILAIIRDGPTLPYLLPGTTEPRLEPPDPATGRWSAELEWEFLKVLRRSSSPVRPGLTSPWG